MKNSTSFHPGWIAGGLVVLVSLWLLSGAFKSEDHTEATENTVERERPRVRVIESTIQLLTRESVTSARTAPLREVILRAEANGRLQEIKVRRGEALKAGQEIARLDAADRPAKVLRAQAKLEQRKLEYSAAQRLRKQKMISPVELANSHSNLALAEAELQEAHSQLDKTIIRAPFDGVLETRALELGHYVNVGDEFGRFIQRMPFLVTAQVTEDVIVFLNTGQTASAILPDGREVEGVLRYVASQADENTRTYPVELKVQGLSEAVIAGGSAVLKLPLEAVRVHVVEPSTLALNDAGEFGVKAVNANGEVEFHAAKIVQAGKNDIWLTGLPEFLRIITIGQGFVSTGDLVDAVVVAPSEPNA